jgi:hypothetical protein
VRLSARPYAYAKSGQPARARQIIRDALAQPDAEHQAYHVAGPFVGLGEYDEALTWLERAVVRQVHDVIFLHVDPRLEPLRSLPKYRELAGRDGWE